MHVEIPAEFEPVIQGFLSQGTYRTEEEVVTEAIRMLQRRQERLDELREAIQPALEQLRRGEGIEVSEENLEAFFDDIAARGDARLKAREAQA